MVETALDTIRIRKFWVGDAVMSALLESVGGDPGHETVGFGIAEDVMKVIEEDELDRHENAEVAAWFAEVMKKPELFDADRIEFILDETARIERAVGRLLGGAEGA